MQVGDLVRMADHEDDDIGIVVKVTLNKARKLIRADVFWGPESTFGSQVEWDWEKDLEVIRESR